MKIDTSYIARRILTLGKAYSLLLKTDSSMVEYDMYRSAAVNEFEIILEQSGKLLKKFLIPYLHSAKAADKLVFKDIFRYAAHHNIISVETCERWMIYCDNRNNVAHDYGEAFAEETLKLLTGFIADARELVSIIQTGSED